LTFTYSCTIRDEEISKKDSTQIEELIEHEMIAQTSKDKTLVEILEMTDHVSLELLRTN